MGRLLAIKIKSYPPGNHANGDNLYLRVKPSGSRSWVFRYKVGGKAIEIGLGSLKKIKTLREAKRLADNMNHAVSMGINPRTLLATDQKTKTFKDYATELIESRQSGWRNEKHGQQWINTLTQYAFPVVGEKAINKIDLIDIKKILTPIWNTKAETANRLRMRIEAVLDYGFLHEGIDRANPARWRGCLDHVFPPKNKVSPTHHFKAIPYDQLPEVMEKLRSQSGLSALCAQWIALTACRSNEGRAMVWSELDIRKRVWTIPGNRMKSAREHRVPLSDACLAILAEAERFKSLSKGGVVFPGARGGALSDVSVSKSLKIASFQEATVHGLRSGFRDWAADKTDYPREVCESALAHTLGGVEAAYRRSDLFEKRRELMNEWGRFLNN